MLQVVKMQSEQVNSSTWRHLCPSLEYCIYLHIVPPSVILNLWKAVVYRFEQNYSS
jgi:hypothetical protein